MDTNGINEVAPLPGNAPTASLPSGPFQPRIVLESVAQNTTRTEIITEYLYVIESPLIGLWKIGITNDPDARLATLQDASAFPLRLHAMYATLAGTARMFERNLHQRYRHLRSHGEWFKLGPEEIAELDADQLMVITLTRIWQSEPYVRREV